jgi:uncharacterized membrane protein YfcA
MDPLVVAFGLGVGVLVGLTGIGGGSLMTPLLVLFAGVQPVIAIGTDLAYGAITKTVGGWRHLRGGTVDLGVSGWLAVGSVPGSLLGVVAVDRLHERHGDALDSWLLSGIAAALAVVAISILGRALFMPGLVARERHSVVLTAGVRASAAGIGLVLGLLTAGIAHLLSGNVDLGLMLNILAGSLPGVWLGTALIARVPAAGLRSALGCVLLGSSLGVLSKAGVDVPTWLIPAAPAAAGLLAFVVHRLRPRPRPEVVPA